MRQMVARGESVINLGEGELDFETPDHAKAAGIAAIERGDTRYTAVGGTERLRGAIVAKFQRENGLTFGLEQVLAGVGGKQILFNALLATVGVGDEVIVPAPYWVSYPDMVHLAEGTPVILPATEDTGFKLTPDALASALTERTRWIILNSPNNPTGAVYSAEELAALLAVIAPWPKVMIMADDIYEHMVFAGTFATPAAVRPDLADRILTVNGVSKAYSMTGWRIGYAAGPRWLIDAMRVIQSQSTSNPAAMSQEAARVALTGSLDFLEERLTILRRRRDHVLTALNVCPGLRCPVPDGAFYVYVNCAGLMGGTTPDGHTLETDTDLAAYLAREAKVGVVPGSAFGLGPYLRIAYAVDDALLDEACTRITAACTRIARADAA
ncbi:pyridoxal phosphate-dependent aminotransferase [Roseospira marina]|uniref:Aminotransferase n=2 Tax=Roseospira marina TaxID=140057 RepID=A0A5M6IET7_9PROT|nr:pyridoxal phosphate-dependent aminotransferase [Roseospira marina]